MTRARCSRSTTSRSTSRSRGGLLRRAARPRSTPSTACRFTIAEGETLALVGESGCGKSTVGRAILRLIDAPPGQVVLDGQRIDDLLRRRAAAACAGACRWSSRTRSPALNPRMRVRDILAEPIRNFGLAKSPRRPRARGSRALLDTVGLPRDAVDRWPHEFSGGQRQRIGIARALAAEPDLIVCDEPVSALDVSVQAQIVNLLQDLQRELGLALLFISHDLAVVEHIDAPRRRDVSRPDRRDGAEAAALRRAAAPLHARRCCRPCRCPSPARARKRIILQGDVPSPINPPQRLPLPHALPLRLRPLPDRGAGAAADRATATSAACHLHDLPGRAEPAGRCQGCRADRRPPLTSGRGTLPA